MDDERNITDHDSDDESDDFMNDDGSDKDQEYNLYPAQASTTTEAIESMVDDLLQVADVDSVYGSPVEHGDTVIIPAAEVMAAMGFGMGVGEGGDGENSGAGSGGGGGGSSFSRPVAVIISSPNGVRVEPIVDITKVALAGISAGVFILGMLARMQKSRRTFRRLDRELRSQIKS